MKSSLLFFLALLFTTFCQAQSAEDHQGVELACMKYLEGFYEGDTTKIIDCLDPELYKMGYWKNEKTGKYEDDGQMTYQQAVDYSRRVMEKKKFAKADAPKKVEVLDIMNHIAAAKITAWWGVDYVLLAKSKDKWLIEQVLWEGPLGKRCTCSRDISPHR